MPQPAKYSNTDAREQQGVVTFLHNIDPNFIKADIKTRDKFPNIDGTIEIVDKDQIPLGKLEVQVKAIKDGETKYDCPSSLVAYSNTVTLPVLIICSDTSKDIVYWKHIETAMPEYRLEQDTFRIHFSSKTDIIDDNGFYIQRWLEIVRDYQERMQKYPLIISEIGPYEGFLDISQSDRVIFQRYLDTINGLFDYDFISFKRALFPGIWKFGVGIFSIKEKSISFQLHKIPYGDVTPLLCKFPEKPPHISEIKTNVMSLYLTSREYLSSPEEKGSEFVFDNIKDLLDRRGLPVNSEFMSTDVIFSFIDDYYPCLGLEPAQDIYTVNSIDSAVNQYLIGFCASYITQISDFTKKLHIVNLDEIMIALWNKSIEPLSLSNFDFNIIIESKKFPLKLVFQSISYLNANGISTIKRPFPRRNGIITPGDNFIWSGFSLAEEIDSVKNILNNSINEYRKFVSGNRLNFPKSPYLDPTKKFIYTYKPASLTSPASLPGLECFTIIDGAEKLPKILVLIKTSNDSQIDTSQYPVISFGGNQYIVDSARRRTADLFFHKLPVVNFIYDMLAKDLNLHYDMGYLSRSHF